jgi:hypothetical protein
MKQMVDARVRVSATRVMLGRVTTAALCPIRRPDALARTRKMPKIPA